MSSIPANVIEEGIKEVSDATNTEDELEHISVDTDSGIFDVYVQVLSNSNIMIYNKYSYRGV